MSALFSVLLYEFSYWVVFFIYVIGFRLRAAGLRNIPRRGAVLVIANHESYLDPIAIGLGVRRHMHYLARKTLFENRLLGWFLRTVNVVPIDQEGVGKEGIRAILRRLEAGNPVLVFPEGNRTEDGCLQPLRPGVGLLISRMRAPIMAVGVAGAYETWSRHRKLPRVAPLFLPSVGRSLTIVYGVPRDPATLDGLSRDEVLAILYDDIAAVAKQAKKLHWKRKSRLRRQKSMQKADYADYRGLRAGLSLR